MAKATKSISEKQILKEQITYQLENSLGKIKDLLGEKKFNSRVKKSVKLFLQGLGRNRKKPKNDAQKIAEKKTSSAPEKLEPETKRPPLKAPAKKKAATKRALPQ